MKSPAVIFNKKFVKPFPGLRSFLSNEAEIFFGCASQVDDMIRRLEDHRFLTVVGPSGCGKSSLVQAGLLPALNTGELFTAGDQWRMVIMRPGESPFNSLANALLESFQDSQNGSDDASSSLVRPQAMYHFKRAIPKNLPFTEAVLRRGPLGFVEAIEDAHAPAETNILLLVDQFEELFRFRHPDQSKAQSGDDHKRHLPYHHSDAKAFVALLLATARQSRRQVYVVLTMRSDFIGDCNSFHGLPEAINNSQFLTPRLDQDQIRDAIIGPLRLFGAEAQPEFVNRMLVDIGSNADHLPLMQHALMRMWNRAADTGKSRENDGNLQEHGAGVTFTLADYLKIGGMRRALSIHANEAYNELDPKDKKVAQILFRVLTERGSDRSDLRRPTRFANLLDIVSAGNPTEEARTQLKRVLEAFRRTDRSFIAPPEGVPLEDPVTLDISHECLIRQWKRLNLWVREEARAAETYRELLPPSRRWQMRIGGRWKALGGLLRGQDLKRVLKWKKQANAAWATLYGGNFAMADKFIRASRIYSALRRTVYIFLAALAIVAVIYYQVTTTKIEIIERLNAELTDLKAKAESFRDDALISESKLWASLSLQETKNGYSTAGMILALDAMHSDDLQRPHEAKAERALYAALHVPHEFRTLAGHSRSVAFGTFSPDGKWAVTGSWDQTARLWNAETGESIHLLKGHEAAVVHVDFSPKSRFIVTSSLDNTARIWDTKTGKPLHLLDGHDRSVQQAGFSPDGSRVVTASSDKTARIWDTKTGQQIHVLTGHKDTIQLATFSPRGTYVLTASWDNTARIWEAKTGKQIHAFEGHTEPVTSAAYGPKGDYVITASHDKTARLWDTKTGREKHVFQGHGAEVMHAAFNPKGDRVVTASLDKTARLWDVRTGVQIDVLEGHHKAVRYAAFSPQGDRVVTASEDKTACLWDAETGERIYFLHRHADKLSRAFFRSQGDRLITVSKDKTARIWYTPRNLLRGHKDAVVHAAFNPPGDRIVTASNDNTACIWDVAGRKQLYILKGHQGPVLHAAFNPLANHRVATASGDSTARIWDAQSGAEIHVLKKHQGPVLHVAYSPRGRRIVTASTDKTARIWQADSGAQIHVLEGHTGEVVSAAFSPNGDRIVTASKDSTARIWDAATGAAIHVLDKHQAAVLQAIFSPAGSVVATVSEDKTARLWDPETGAMIRVLPGHTAAVLRAAFSQPDGRLLVTVSDDKTALLWSLTKKADKPVGPAVTADSATDLLESSQDADITYSPLIVLRHEGPIRQAMFSRKGNRVVTASEDGTAVLWNADSANRIAVLSGHKNTVHMAAYSPDGRLVLSASEDGTVRLWDIFDNPEDLVQHTRTVVKNRELGEEEQKRVFPY